MGHCEEANEGGGGLTGPGSALQFRCGGAASAAVPASRSARLGCEARASRVVLPSLVGAYRRWLHSRAPANKSA